MLEKALNKTEYYILRLRRKFNIATTQGKIDFAAAVVPVLAHAEPVERDLYMSRISEEIGINRSSLEAQIKDYLVKSKRKQKKKNSTRLLSIL